MTDEQRNLAWAYLPREIREEIKVEYSKVSILPRKEQYELGMLHTFENIFGIHNLTLDTEPEEMLFCPKKKAQEYKASVDYGCKNEIYTDYDKGYWFGQHAALANLFGDKCLPDKVE